LLPHRKQDNPNSRKPHRQNHGAVEKPQGWKASLALHFLLRASQCYGAPCLLRPLQQVSAVGHFGFFVAALYERRLLNQQIPALIERRYSKLTHYPSFCLRAEFFA
jgi:hypothetical protein